MRTASKKILLLLGLALFASSSYSQIKSLYVATSDTGFIPEVFDTTIAAKQNIRFDYVSLKSTGNDTFKIILPSVITVRQVRVIKSKQTVTGEPPRFSWFGKIEGQPTSLVLFSNVGNAVSGYIRDSNNKVYRIQYRGNNVHQITEINTQLVQPDRVMQPQPVMAGAETEKKCCDTIAHQVDVMVVYTVKARDSAGGTSSILSAIEICIQQANLSYQNSNLNQSLNLVHTAEVSYVEDENAELNLERLINPTDGPLDEVHHWRDTYDADIVVLMVDFMAGFTGISRVMTTNSVAFASQALCVVRYNDSFSSLVFTHEVGHIMGAGHELCDANWSGLFTYSHAFTGSNYRTVMAMSATNRIEYWSNPAINYPGATGTPMGVSGGACPSNNSLTLAQTISTVTKFRCKTVCENNCRWLSSWWFWITLILAILLLVFLYWFFFRRNRS